MRMKTLVGAAAIAAVLPMTAGAAVVSEGINFGGTYNVPGNYSSVVMFESGEPGGTLTWTFQNTSAVAQAVTLASATVQQLGTFAFFTNGTTTALNGDSEETNQGQVEGFELSTIIAAGGTADLSFTFGQVFETPGSDGGLGNDVVFDFNIASTATAIPLPASVFMLLGALGGLTFMSKRRRSV